jgi:phosphotransacetylase
MTTIRLGNRFIDDHYDRGLPTPEDVGNTHAHAVVRADDPALRELLADAEHYAVMIERRGRCDCMPRGIVASARATVRAIRDVIGWDDAEPAIKALRK